MSSTRAGDRARGFEIDPVEQNRGNDEALARSHHGKRRFPVAVRREDLDLPVNDDMEKVSRVPLARKIDMGGEALKERYPQHRFHMCLRDAREEGQAPHLLDLVAAHSRSPECWRYPNTARQAPA